MKKTSLLALALAPMILGTPLGLLAQDESVTTDPVGFVKLNLEPGLQTVGLPMVKSAIAAGLVTSNDATSITLQSEPAALGEGEFYLEVVDGPDTAPWVGDRFEIASVAGNVVTIDTASSLNTASLDTANLADYSIVIRPHLTVSEAFPPAEMTEGDQIMLFNAATGGFDVITLETNIFTGGLAWAQDVVLAPGTGLFYRSAATEASSTVNLGAVRVNNFRQPLDAGLNLIAEGHPLDNSPSSRLMTSENGFEAGDQILAFNKATGGFDVVTYEENIFTGELQWTSDAELMEADGAVFVRKVTADTSYEAPATF